MRQNSLLTVIFVSAIILTGCGKSSYSSTELSNYGLWNQATSKILQTDFRNSLPEEDVVKQYGKEYYYTFDQGILSYPNFVISVVLQFSNEVDYEEFLNEHNNLLLNSVQHSNTTYYTIQYSYEDFLEYTNSDIYDGMFYCFEIMSVCRTEHTIQIVNAYVWDSHYDPFLGNYLQQIQRGASKTGDGLREP